MRSPGRRLWLWLAIAGGLLFALVVFLISRFPGGLANQTAQVNLAQGLLLAVLLVGSLILRARVRPGYVLASALAWIGIGLVLLLAYTFRDEAAAVGNRLLGELMPRSGIEQGGAMTFRAGPDGHFSVEADVDGARVDFLVDTGASDVVLSPRDAQRIGIDPATLSYTRIYGTANGTVQGAPVRLKRVRIGTIVMDDVPASVNAAPMDRSLLGMSFLGRLSGYSVENGVLTLRP
jgi:aspartyl protease family protein